MLPHALEHEQVESVAGMGIPGPQGFEDDQRLSQSDGVVHGPLEREVGPQPAGARHPIEDETAVGPDGAVVLGVQAVGAQAADYGGLHPAGLCIKLSIRIYG